MNPIHPRRIKKGDTLYNEEGRKLSVMLVIEVSGTWDITMTSDKGLVEIFYDSHDYLGDGGEPLPGLYRKKPKGA